MRRAQVGLIHLVFNQLVRNPSGIQQPTHIRFLYLLSHINVLSQIALRAGTQGSNYRPAAPHPLLAAVALCTRRMSLVNL